MATFAVMLPSFVLVNILAVAVKSSTNSLFSNTLFDFLRPVIIALIVNAGITIGIDALNDIGSVVILLISFFLVWKTKIHPIIIIAISGVCGIVFYGLF